MSLLALPLLLVPATLMVSTIRYRSFKTFNLGQRRPASALMLFALLIAAIATYPQWSLVLISYTYLLSGFVGLALAKVRPKPVEEPAHAAPLSSAPALDVPTPIQTDVPREL
jgi:CDP-diacylglycerol--serine O-phosphatidyltransferase